MTLSSDLLTLVLKEGTDSLSFTEQHPHHKHTHRHHGCLPFLTHISGSAPASWSRPILHLESLHLSRPAPNRTSQWRLSGALWLKVTSPTHTPLISSCHSPIPLLGSPPLEDTSQTSQTSVILSLWAHLRHLPSEAKPGPQLLQPPSTSITLSTSENQTSPWCCRHAQKAYVCFPALDWEVGILRGIPKCSCKFSTVPASHTQ